MVKSTRRTHLFRLLLAITLTFAVLTPAITVARSRRKPGTRTSRAGAENASQVEGGITNVVNWVANIIADPRRFGGCGDRDPVA